MRRLVPCFVVLVGLSCGMLTSSGDAPSTPDASTSETSTPPPPPDHPSPPPPPSSTTKCDPSKPFAEAVLVSDLDKYVRTSTPRLTPDELVVYFEGFDGVVYDVYVARRGARELPFGPPQKLTGLRLTPTDPTWVAQPTISDDERRIVFMGEKIDAAIEYDLYEAWHVDGGTFADASPLTGFDLTGVTEGNPFLTTDGLWFTSDYDASAARLWHAPLAGGGFGAPSRVQVPVDAGAQEVFPAFSADGLTLYIAVAPNAGDKSDIQMLRRSTTGAPFEFVRTLTELATKSNEFPGWISPDDCRLYFSSDRSMAGAYKLYVASRPKP